MLTSNPAWRELFRCDDLQQARAVATSIAAMEFDVRLASGEPFIGSDLAENANPAASRDASSHALPDDLPGPYVIEVPVEHWSLLAPALRDIIEEQLEFDEWLEMRKHRHRRKLLLVLAAVGAVDVLVMWRVMDS